MPTIENSLSIELPPERALILQEMFTEYDRVLIKKDFSAVGYSGSWVYQIHLIKDDRLELPVVVKIAAVSLVEKERLAYERCVKNQWAGIATLREQFVSHDKLAGLCYPFMGGGIFELISLREYCLKAEMKEIRFVLQERLFRIMKQQMLLPATRKLEYPLRACYDSHLPVNLLIKVPGTQVDSPTSAQHKESPIEISPDKLPAKLLPPHTPVHVKGFVISKVDLDKNTVTLNLPNRTYRLRLRATNLATYHVGEALPPVEGVIIETRRSRFESELAKLNLEELNIKVETQVTLPDGAQLPNPLHAIPTILSQTRHLRFNCIHGDLNLENVLVDPKVRDVYLIDFAEAHDGYVLHDFLRLETEVITKLIPPALVEANLPPQTIYDFYQQLHRATWKRSGANNSVHEKLEKAFAILSTIREAAHDGFFDRHDFREYYEGLTLYLVGALRFSNLDQLSKQVAFLGASTIAKLHQEPQEPPKSEVSPEPPELVIASSSIPPEPVVRSSTPPVSRRLAILAGVLLTTVIVAALAWWLLPDDIPAELGKIIELTPQVEVERSDGKIEDGENLMPLYQNNWIRTNENGVAAVLLLCPEKILILQIASYQNMPIDCQKAENAKLEIRKEFDRSLLFAPTEPNQLPVSRAERSTRGEQTETPLLLTPRNTTITDTHPTFEWQAIAGASGYHIELLLPNSSKWEGQTTNTSLSYPVHEPPLPSGNPIFVQLTTLDDPTKVDESLLTIMDESQKAEVEALERQIRELELDKTAQAYLLAQLYRQQEMKAAAIAQLEQIAATEENISADLWQQLGALYFEIKRDASAEENYQMALEVAQANQDQHTQANAYVGLALVADTFGESEEARNYLTQAEELYRQIGQTQKAEQVVELRNKIK